MAWLGLVTWGWVGVGFGLGGWLLGLGLGWVVGCLCRIKIGTCATSSALRLRRISQEKRLGARCLDRHEVNLWGIVCFGLVVFVWLLVI